MRYIVIIMCAIILYAGDLFSQSRITHNNKEIFLSGINLAWVDFAKDLKNFDKATFARALDEISSEGGNCVRWWLHINGRYTPEFT